MGTAESKREHKLCLRVSAAVRAQLVGGCNNDYGFSSFTVSTDQISAQYVSATSTFTDNFVIKVSNPPGDFSISAGPVSVSRGVGGGPDTYSGTRSVFVNSFGGTSGASVSLTIAFSGPSGTCPGTNCPSVTLGSASVTIFAGTAVSSSLVISTTPSTPCGNPRQSPANVYSITVTATSGSVSRSYTFSLYVYGRADVNKDGIDNILDVLIVNNKFGKNSGDPDFNPNSDLNNDGHIDILDV